MPNGVCKSWLSPFGARSNLVSQRTTEVCEGYCRKDSSYTCRWKETSTSLAPLRSCWNCWGIQCTRSSIGRDSEQQNKKCYTKLQTKLLECVWEGGQYASNYDHSDAQVTYPTCALVSANNLVVSAEGGWVQGILIVLYRHIVKHVRRETWAPNPHLHLCGLRITEPMPSAYLAQVLIVLVDQIHNIYIYIYIYVCVCGLRPGRHSAPPPVSKLLSNVQCCIFFGQLLRRKPCLLFLNF